MTVKELITQLLDCPMDAEVIIQKELDFNIWVNSEAKIAEKDYKAVVLSFDFPTDKFNIQRKKG